MLVCHFTSKQLYMHRYNLTVSSLSFARKSSSERDYHLCKDLNGEAASIEFAGARTNETRDLLQYRACLEILTARSLRYNFLFDDGPQM